MLTDKKILLVEDESVLREIVCAELEILGAQVTQAGTGNTAFNLVQKHSFDAVLTDIRMPDGDGILLLENIQKHLAKKPIVVFLSGHSDLSDSGALSLGASAIFTKPFDINIVASTLSRLLEEPKTKWSRTTSRIDLSLNIDMVLSSIESAIQLKTLNIGNGGMFICTDGPLPESAKLINFKIYFSNTTESILGQGLVRWVRSKSNSEGPRGFGIEFYNLDQKSLEFIENYLALHKTNSHIPKS